MTALDGRRGLGPPLHLLALDVDAALAAYGAALAGGDAGRIADTRAILGTAAAALASWCGSSVPPGRARPPSHGERRGSPAAPPYVLDGMRALAAGLAADVRCRVCDGSGLRSPCDMEPCRACAGAGVP